MKSLKQSLVGLLCSFAAAVQACWAEFGEQSVYPGLRAGGDLRALQYRVMRGAGSGYTNMSSVTAVTSLGAQQVLGVLQNDPNTDEAATVAFQGLSKVVTGAAVTAQMLATHNASGQAIDAVSGAVVIGRFMEATNAAGEIATIMLFPPTRWGAIL
jgi:hypothetical protein